MGIRLIAADLDGTMLDGGGRVPAENAAAVREASEAGIIFTIATGRMFASARKFARELGVRVPFICFNGAMARWEDGRTLYHRPLDLEVARGCLGLCRERGIYVQSYTDDELLVRDVGAGEYGYYSAHYGAIGRPVGDALYEPTTAPTKLLAMTSGIEETHEVIEMFEGAFPGRLYATSSDANFVEIMDASVSKARSLADLAESLGVKMAEVMSLGDGENDAEMIAASGVGVAMANAREKAKAAARVIAPSNDDCGVAWAIRELALK